MRNLTVSRSLEPHYEAPRTFISSVISGMSAERQAAESADPRHPAEPTVGFRKHAGFFFARGIEHHLLYAFSLLAHE